MLALVAIHVAGVLASSWRHRENLVGAMVHGRKAGAPDDAIRRSWRVLAAVLLATVVGFWWWQWQLAPVPQADQRPAEVTHHDRKNDD